MIVWLVGWVEPTIVDGVVVISMALKVAPDYMIWWIVMHPGLLGLDEADNGSDDVASPPLKEKN